MWGSSLWQSILALCLFTTTIQALQVTSNSDCQSLCTDISSDSDSSTTNSTDIVCEDNEFSTTGKGIRYKNCLTCLQTSNATQGKESDVFSFLYNVRYAFDVCIFSYPEPVTGGTINSPCNIGHACADLEIALKTSLVNRTVEDQFDYCEASNSAMTGNSYDSCITCLQSTASQTYFSNFLIALRAGCEQRPGAGDLIGLNETIFTSEAVNITNPTTNSTLPGDGGATFGSMSTGTIVGIALGCILAFIGGIVLLFLYFRKQRRERMRVGSPPDALMNNYDFNNIRNGDLFIRRQRAAEGPPSYNSAQYYDKLETDRQAALNYYQIPQTNNSSSQAVLPAHPAYIPQVWSRPSIIPTSVVSPNAYPIQSHYNPSVAGPKVDLNFANLNSVPASAVPSNIVTQDISSAVNDSRSSSRQEILPRPPPPAAKVPSLGFPSLAKFKMPRMYTPPQVLGQNSASSAAKGKPSQSELNISKPLAVLEARFLDKPLRGGQVLATEAPSYFRKTSSKRQKRSPMPTSNTMTSVGSDQTRNLW